jgi:hypothetical protein
MISDYLPCYFGKHSDPDRGPHSSAVPCLSSFYPSKVLDSMFYHYSPHCSKLILSNHPELSFGATSTVYIIINFLLSNFCNILN